MIFEVIEWPQNSANDLDLVAWQSEFNALNGRAEPASVRPFVRRTAVQMEGA
jgi:hypothetical protein